MIAALREFGAPMLSSLTEADFAKAATVFQMGLPPCRIDVITEITGVSFPEAWQGRVEGTLGTCPVPFLGKESFIKNKRATGRLKDLADAEALDG